MRKTIIKLEPGDVVTVDKDKVIIESKENTTAENSDVVEIEFDGKEIICIV